MSSNRLAPMPPPKPRNLGPGRGHIYHGVDGFLTPQDSDTDSGISADCDQGSPRAGFGASNLRRTPQDATGSYQNIRSQSSADYLTPNSARKIAAYSTPRRLPSQPQQGNNLNNKTKYRVRFADEVDSGASTSSGTSSTHISPRNDAQELLMNSAVTAAVNQPAVTVNYPQNMVEQNKMGMRGEFGRLNRVPMPQNNQSLQPRSGTLQRTPIRRSQISSTPQPQPTYLDQMQADPPPYTIAMQRLRPSEQPSESFRDAYIRKNVADTLQRRFRQRSSSLPRGNKSYYDGIDSLDYQPQYPPAQQTLVTSSGNLPGSLDNLHITMGSMRRRKLPTAPLMGSSCQLHVEENDLTAYRALQFQMMQEELQRQQQQQQHQQQQPPPHFERQPTLLRRTNLGKYGLPHFNSCSPPVPYEPNDFGPNGVRAQLVALDQRGFRRVLVEKMLPGPFGFYIATGMVAGQRGIFISRVSLSSLSPMLTVGDEIIYVDEELVKGRSLEYVQSVIAGKTTVTITLLPAVGQPALC